MPAYDSSPTDADLARLLAPAGEPLSHYVGLPGAPSTATMLRAIEAGALPATRDGKRWLVTRADFAAWITARRERADRSPASPLPAPSGVARVRDAAHVRMVAPDAVLAVTLSRALVAVPVAPAILAAVVGGVGTGKSAGAAVSAELVPLAPGAYGQLAQGAGWELFGPAVHDDDAPVLWVSAVDPTMTRPARAAGVVEPLSLPAGTDGMTVEPPEGGYDLDTRVAAALAVIDGRTSVGDWHLAQRVAAASRRVRADHPAAVADVAEAMADLRGGDFA